MRRRWVMAAVLGVLSVPLSSWLLAVLAPARMSSVVAIFHDEQSERKVTFTLRFVPAYPRIVSRAWRTADGRIWSSSEGGRLGIAEVHWEERSSFPALPTEADWASTVRIARIVERPPRIGSLAGGRVPEDRSEGGSLVEGRDAAFGLPLACLWYSVRRDGIRGWLHGGVPVTRRVSLRGAGDLRVLPLRPIWWALAVNMAVWTVAWWMLLTGPRRVVRWRRRRRGRCGACGYELSGLAGDGEGRVICPECGAGGAALEVL